MWLFHNLLRFRIHHTMQLFVPLHLIVEPFIIAHCSVLRILHHLCCLLLLLHLILFNLFWVVLYHPFWRLFVVVINKTVCVWNIFLIVHEICLFFFLSSDHLPSIFDILKVASRGRASVETRKARSLLRTELVYVNKVVIFKQNNYEILWNYSNNVPRRIQHRIRRIRLLKDLWQVLHRDDSFKSNRIRGHHLKRSNSLVAPRTVIAQQRNLLCLDRILVERTIENVCNLNWS